MNTILITGSSSGFGLETARYFLEQGWQVIATMRTPREDLLPRSANLRMLKLDVSDAESIRRAVQEAGPIDVLVNNAGIGWMGSFEGTPASAVREMFEANTFGTMEVTRAFLPQLRERKQGVIINVTSSVTLALFPMLAAYTASKAATDAFSASLAHELQPFGVRVHLVIPGASPETPFGETARALIAKHGSSEPEAYADYLQTQFAQFSAALSAPGAALTTSRAVAEVIWRAVNDASSPLRLPAGADAVALAR